MSDPLRAIEPTTDTGADSQWSGWLVLFLRLMAVVSMAKGLYHWSLVIGVGEDVNSTFELAPVAWKAATIFFAVIDLVAAVGLWLAAAWGGVVWLTAALSMIAVELLFPNVFGGRWWVIVLEMAAVAVYLTLAVLASRERAE